MGTTDCENIGNSFLESYVCILAPNPNSKNYGSLNELFWLSDVQKAFLAKNMQNTIAGQ